MIGHARALLAVAFVAAVMGAVGAGPALALSTQPSAASNVGQTTATLNATVNPGGVPLTDCHFEYLRWIAYTQDVYRGNSGYSDLSSGGSVPCVPAAGSIPSDSSDHAVSAVVSGLPPGVIYEFRVVVSNAGGSSPGTDGNFETTALPFAISSFDGSVINADGSTDTQAGSHPFAVTAGFTLNAAQDIIQYGSPIPAQNVKDVNVDLPPGFVGNPVGIPQCRQVDLNDLATSLSGCSAASQVGQLRLNLHVLNDITVPVYNMVPGPGEPAQFAATIANVNIYIDFHVRSGSDYGLTATLRNIPTPVPISASALTVWGVPADPAHDVFRGALCNGAPIPANCFNGGQSSGGLPKPLVTLPSSCAGPQTTNLSLDTWDNPGAFLTASFVSHDAAGHPIGLDGCNKLQFHPSISAQPDNAAADSPAGLHVSLRVPQEGLLEPDGLAAANLKKAVVTLPAGTSVNPAAANGLASCAPEQIALSSPAGATCPDASKVGTVQVITPLLDHPLAGDVFLAAQNNNPFGSLLALYIAVNDPVTGVVIKLAGHVVPDPVTGQLTATFDNNPQLPFSEVKLDFFGGSRGPLATPDTCGVFQTTSQLTPWSAVDPANPLPGEIVNAADSFSITSGANGAPCAASETGLPFTPGFSAGSTNPVAGSNNTGFSLSLTRSDGQQHLGALTTVLPSGLLARLAGVPLCADADAGAGSCPAASLIGHATVGAGPGADPFFLSGQPVYLTGPYKGAPYGLAVVTHAVAGPFDLGSVIVRAAIFIDPHDAHVTVVSDQFPSILQGIPLRLRRIDVNVDRPGFVLNPTSCNPMKVTASVYSVEGATALVSSPFQAGGCQALTFKPKLSVSTAAKTSKANGASLRVKLVPPHEGPQPVVAGSGTGLSAEEANIARVKVELPKALPSQLKTLQKACTSAQFDSNPAGCPEASVVGSATARTPLLANPLSGPAYFVSRGGAAFPQLVVVLQGEGITVDLVGDTFISKTGITSSTFGSVPDVPVSSFELNLPQGKYSALAANGNLCAQKLAMPTEYVAQNGTVIHDSTPVKVEGCTNTLSVISHSLKNHNLTITVSVPGPGKLTATGKGLSKTSKTTKNRETVKLTLHTTKNGKLSTNVKLTFTPTNGTKLYKTLPITLKK